MTVSDFLCFFLGIIYWKTASLFNGGICFSDRGVGGGAWRASFLSGGGGGAPHGGIGFDGDFFFVEKNHSNHHESVNLQSPCPPTMGNPVGW